MLIGRSNPFFDKYFRYTVSWLLFGVFGPIYLWQWDWLFALFSIIIAFFLTIGADMIFLFIVRQKVKAVVKEAPLVATEAVRLRLERRGYLVLTNRFVLFVPVLGKIKTVYEVNQIVRYKVEHLQLDLTVRFRNHHRFFSFYVISAKKLLPCLREMSGQHKSYKLEKISNLNR